MTVLFVGGPLDGELREVPQWCVGGAYNHGDDDLKRHPYHIANGIARHESVSEEEVARLVRRWMLASSQLTAENAKLLKALEGLICWAGKTPEGPDWATPDAKARNRASFEKAVNDACDCFPENYNGIQQLLESN